MGGYFSLPGYNEDPKQICYDPTNLTTQNVSNKPTFSENDDYSLNQLSQAKTSTLDDFEVDLAQKRDLRTKILAEKRKQMEDLRNQVIALTRENEALKSLRLSQTEPEILENAIELSKVQKENEELKEKLESHNNDYEKYENVLRKNRELQVSIAEMQQELQGMNSEVVSFESERQDYRNHVVALKDVIKVSKQMLLIRDGQIKELREKLESIESSLAGREMNLLSTDLRCEYERQLQNIRNLRALYEERQRADKLEKEELTSKLQDATKQVESEKTKSNELQGRITELESENSKKYDEIKSLESNLGLSKAECRQHQAELAVINQLFSEILLGFNSSQDIDLDKLTRQLEEHHGLLQNIVVNEISTEVSSALPKMVLDLVNRVSGNDEELNEEQIEKLAEASGSHRLETIVEESEFQTSTTHQMNTAEEIVENLPKVWKVLIELLSHHKAPIENVIDGDENICYKVVETAKGPNLVLSVSQTYIRLKDLILEKKSLEKETSNLKQLNGHLENRLQDQEKRLETVTNELSKTWKMVGKLQKQHQLLHTQEKILRYELAQKRKLLTELKEELEYSREKCIEAKKKNSSTEEQWKQLRSEFALRRKRATDDLNNSSESGYSDDKEESSDDEPGYETDISECNQNSIAENASDNSITKEVPTVVELVKNKNENEKVHSKSKMETDLVKEMKTEKTNSTNLEEACSSSQKQTSPDNYLNNEQTKEETNELCTLQEEESKEQKPSSIQREEIVNSITENSKELQERFKEDPKNCSTNNKILEVIAEKTYEDQQPSTSSMSEKTLEVVESIKRIEDAKNNKETTNSTSIELAEAKLTEPCTSFQNRDQEKLVESRVSLEAETNSSSKPQRTLEEVLKARDERFKRLESEAQQLVTKVTDTNTRSADISYKLDNLHETYGEISSREETSIEENSVEETFIEETSREETSIEETSVEESSREETSIEETPREETSIVESSREETPREDTENVEHSSEGNDIVDSTVL